MRGAIAHWLFNGYKRTLAQAPYFVVPLALGKLSLARRRGIGETTAEKRGG